MFLGGRGFNNLIHKYFLEEWKQIYQFSLKNKTKEDNSAAIYFPWILYESILQSIFVFCFSFSWFMKLIIIYAKNTGADAGGCHLCQCSNLKWLTLISRFELSFQTWLKVGVGDTAVSEMLGWRIHLSCPVFNTICNSLQCTKCLSLFPQLPYKFSEWLDVSCSKAMAFRMVEIGQ